ncbi:MAG: bifunctional phosphopantothenoylcysteine decarboxylase/phosphopantothenate--cysteine ligase CoaBC [Saprospiraceae bacterium]|nr:bifunctional phosphopantothenoylcysteine decarboxylase/phosphopantothenate--cysteine ligase CoaBC [Saprospiraceae bacterium]
MEVLVGKKIVLGITGSIAAYKSAFLIRLLVKSGAEVKVVMTESATQFISPLTISTLSKHRVLTQLMSEDTWNNHVEIGLWADLMIVAPMSANTLAKMAMGQCDNMLLAVYLSAKCKTLVAPAMDLDMWIHPTTKRNIDLIKSDGVGIINVQHGELASGLVGEGRMAEPEDIFAQIVSHFHNFKDFDNKRVLITAGPTYESIDPVRFIGNYSSGKMGYNIAQEFAERGALVTLVSGPTSLANPQYKNLEVIKVKSADEMYEKCLSRFEETDIAVLAAAVADYKPKVAAKEKIKKKTDDLVLELTKTVDIAASLGKLKKPHQKIIGFALETTNEIEHAQQKLEKKSFDFIVLNSLNDAGAGFNHDTNNIKIIDKQVVKEFGLDSKKAHAKTIVNEIKSRFFA